MTATPIRVGDVVHGRLNGYFWPDHYGCAWVEAVGADWAIVRTFDGTAIAGTGDGIVTELELSRDGYDGQHDYSCPACGKRP